MYGDNRDLSVCFLIDLTADFFHPCDGIWVEHMGEVVNVSRGFELRNRLGARTYCDASQNQRQQYGFCPRLHRCSDLTGRTRTPSETGDVNGIPNPKSANRGPANRIRVACLSSFTPAW
jgi:hypothetical protein